MQSSSAYLRYKEDTLAFTTWLAKTARKCGHRGDVQPQRKDPAEPITTKGGGGGRLKGKERTEAKKKKASQAVGGNNITHLAVKFIVSTKDIILQAEAIARNAVAVPNGVWTVAKRAISARKRFADWYSGSGKEEHEQANKAHRYFIEVLEKALGLLTPPGFSEPTAAVAYSGQQKQAKDSTHRNDDLEDLGNRFGRLDVEDVDEEAFEISAEEVSASIDASTAALGLAPGQCDVYELDTPEDGEEFIEVIFSIFCFFEDLQRLLGVVKETWDLYMDRKLDYITATFVTNSAIDIARRNEEALIEGRPDSFSEGAGRDSYIELVLSILCSHPWKKVRAWEGSSGRIESLPSDEAFHQMQKMKEEFLQGSQLCDFVYLPAAVPLQKYRSFRAHDESNIMSIKAINEHEAARRALGLGIYLEEEGVSEKQEKDDHWVTQLLLEEEMWGAYEDFDSCECCAQNRFKDGFTQALRKCALGEICAWTSFATTLALFIHDRITGPAGALMLTPYQSMQLDGKKAERKIEPYLHDCAKEGCKEKEDKKVRQSRRQKGGNNKTKHSIEWDGSDPCTIRASDDVNRFLHGAILRTGALMMGVKQVFQQLHYHRDGPTPDDVIPMAKEENFSFANNPLCGGTLGLFLKTKLSNLFLELANHDCAVFATAHMYNCLRQLNILPDTFRWNEMDRIIELHLRPLFRGELPKTAKDCCSRMAVAGGITMRLFSPDASNRSLAKKPFGKRTCNRNLRMDNFCLSLWKCGVGEITLAQCLHELHDAMIDLKQPAAANSKRRSGRQLSDAQFLRRVRNRMPAALDALSVDYAAFTIKCKDLLDEVAEEIKINNGPDHYREAANIGLGYHGCIVMAINILLAAKNWEAASSKNKNKSKSKSREKGSALTLDDAPEGPEPGHLEPNLEIAGKVFLRFFQKG